MVANIEQLKSQYTDKFVKVDDSRPELARFRGHVGQIKTVNMNGRALVEFLHYHMNIGWYDIDLNYVTVVDPPPPQDQEHALAKRSHDKPEGKAAPTTAAKPAKDAAAKMMSPLEMARTQGAAGSASTAKPQPGGAAPAKAAGEKKKSVAEILAAARGGAGGAPAANPPAGNTAAKPPAAPKPGAEAGAAKPAAPKGKMSVAEILAAARGASAAKSQAAPAAAAVSGEATTPPIEQSAKPQPEQAATPAAGKSRGSVARVDKSNMSVAEIIAYCREHDAKAT